MLLVKLMLVYRSLSFFERGDCMFKKLLVAAALSCAPVISMAADLPARGPAAAPSPVYAVPSFAWTGFYAGVHVGYGWADHALTNSSPPGPATRVVSVDSDGVLGGVQAGYNWQINSFVLGLVADVTVPNLSGRFSDPLSGPPPGPPYTVSSKIDWMATLRARAGFLLTPGLLAYAHGGLAVADVNGSWIALPPGGGPGPWQGRGSATRAGWTVGAGVEYRLARNISAFVEYAYADFGDYSFANRPGRGPAVSYRHTSEVHSVKLGLNYAFGGSTAPVVARY
jgi:outer membrane immunogenic protein